ncbi:MAG: putative lipopolysaccharide heptosyltransferase III [Simkaniaceae bacterium]
MRDQIFKKILVSKLRHHGDVLLSAPLFSLLKKRFPDAQIDAHIYKETLPMLQGHPAISNFLCVDKNWKKKGAFFRYFQELKLLRQIKKGGYDLALNLTEGDRGAMACKVSGALIRVGFDPEKSGMRGKRKFYTHVARILHGERHTVERHFDVLRVIGIFPEANERELFFHIPEKARLKAMSLLSGAGIYPGRFTLIHPTSRWLFKCLPASTMAALILELDKRGKKIVITSSPSPEEREMVSQILLRAPKMDLLDLSGKTTLKELGALIEMSEHLITVDSLPLHISSAFKKPVLAIFGPTSEKSWAPWQNPYARVVTKQMPCRPCYMPGCGGSEKSDCLESLDVQEILRAFDSIDQSLNSSPK